MNEISCPYCLRGQLYAIDESYHRCSSCNRQIITSEIENIRQREKTNAFLLEKY